MIIGPPTATQDLAFLRIPSSADQVFRAAIFPAVWQAALDHGIDPVVLVAQSALETGWGRFGGVINAGYFNTCGLKTRTGGDNSDPDAHARFGSWEEGARAHAQHMIRYTGAQTVPGGTIVDPRWSLVGPPHITTIAELEGRWATSPGYGQRVYDIAERLAGK